jgi:DNA-binding CsgD family transcriptional regulator
LLRDADAEQKLTPREARVLQLVADGNSAKEIAGTLGIAPRTVERYIETCRLKLRARNRSHLVNIAAREGFLPIGLPIPPRQLSLDISPDSAKD